MTKNATKIIIRTPYPTLDEVAAWGNLSPKDREFLDALAVRAFQTKPRRKKPALRNVVLRAAAPTAPRSGRSRKST